MDPSISAATPTHSGSFRGWQKEPRWLKEVTQACVSEKKKKDLISYQIWFRYEENETENR